MAARHSLIDPAEFLGSFRVDEGVFDLGGRLFPGSIRDQVVRTRLLVQQIALFGLLDKPRKICIIGAGAAGMTAAMELCDLDSHDVLLVDQARLPLSLLAVSEHRRISPTLYDWPAEHHRGLAYGPMPYYEEGPPSLVRNEWISVFRRLVNAGKLKWHSDTTAVHDSGKMVSFTDHGGNESKDEFDLLFLCLGYGKERSIPIENRTEKFSPIPFWQPDPYPTIANRSPSTEGLVVILGGGDGAIQDMLRFVTLGHDARTLLNEMTVALPSANLRNVWELIENEVRCRELAGETLSASLSKDVEDKISALIEDPYLAAKLNTLIGYTNVAMYFQGEALGRCYPLNRFLTLVFRAYIKRTKGWDLLHPRHTAVAVRCACVDDHFDKPHTVLFAPAAGEKEGKELTCQVVVPRLGIDEETLPIKRRLSHDVPSWLGNWKPVL